ncbi:MAG: radical SAM protein [Deltaproteobacteria bacterium]|nr:radical SAM protein [Deltaproteobacteria bacterium]
MRSVFKRLRDARWAAVQKLSSDIHELRYLFWESTRRCNMECRHCGSDCGKNDAVRGLDADTVLRVLGRIAKAYDAEKIMLTVTGGEPLVRPDMIPVMAKARALGFRFSLVTNGWAVDDKVAEALARAGIESVVVSLDGTEEDHDWLRRREGSHLRSCEALACFADAGVPIVEAITCVTPRSLSSLEKAYELVTSTGATHWRIFNIFPIGRAKGRAELLLDETGMRRLVRSVADLRKRGKKDGVVVNLSEEGWLGWDFEKKVRDTPYFCRAGVNIAGIMADGSIAACLNLPSWMAQGNIGRDDFVEVWEKKYELFRDRSWMKQGGCAECAEWKVCRGNSLHLWDDEKKAPCWCHHKILHQAAGNKR